jgi:hypothetical protein
MLPDFKIKNMKEFIKIKLAKGTKWQVNASNENKEIIICGKKY